MTLQGDFLRGWQALLAAVTVCSFMVIAGHSAYATPLSARTQVAMESGLARNIRHLPCISRKTKEEGVCMFALSCLKVNGTHLGVCIDRFYYGSCCKVSQGHENLDLLGGGHTDSNQITSGLGVTLASIKPRPTAASVAEEEDEQQSSSLSTPSTTRQPAVSSAKPTTLPPKPATIPLTTTNRPTTPTRKPSVTTKRPITSAPSQKPSSATQKPSSVTQKPSSSITQKPSSTISQKPTSTTQKPSGVAQKPVAATTKPPKPDQSTNIKPVIAQGSTPVPVTTKKPPVTTKRPVTISKPPVNSATTIKPSTASSSSTTPTKRPVKPASPSRPSNATTPKPRPTTVKPVQKPATTTKAPAATPASVTITSTSRPVSTTTINVPVTTKAPVTTKRPVTTKKPSTTTSTTTKEPSNTKIPSTSTQSNEVVPTLPVSPVVAEEVEEEETNSVVGGPPTVATPPTFPPTKPTQPFKPSTQVTDGEWVQIEYTTTSSLSTSGASTVSQGSFVTEEIPGSGSSTSAFTTASSVTSETTSPAYEGSSTLLPDFDPALNMSDYKQVCGRRLFPESRIVGGTRTTFGKWPWQISLRQWRTSTYLHKCGAALLNENWAITAAHCVENVPPSDLLLRLGEHDLSTEAEPYGHVERRVQIVASHPQFDSRTFEYDLALLRFYEPVPFKPNVVPVCIPEDDKNFVGSTAFVTGWGRLYEDGPLPSVMQEVSVPVINNSVCETMYRSAGYIEHIPAIFICAGWKKGGFDSCEGDSGGPMVIQREDRRWVLAGVISWGIGCAEPNQPGVYTRISEFRDWINQILQF